MKSHFQYSCRKKVLLFGLEFFPVPLLFSIVLLTNPYHACPCAANHLKAYTLDYNIAEKIKKKKKNKPMHCPELKET